jgi:hypothetical protein
MLEDTTRLADWCGQYLQQETAALLHSASTHLQTESKDTHLLKNEFTEHVRAFSSESMKHLRPFIF